MFALKNPYIKIVRKKSRLRQQLIIIIDQLSTNFVYITFSILRENK